MQKKFYKFKLLDNSSLPSNDVYVDLMAIYSFTKYQTGTSLCYGNNNVIYVEESVAEIIAILEDRDPTPAKVLFGKRDE